MTGRRARRVASAPFVVLLLVLTPMTVLASRSWTLDASPTSLTLGAQTNVTLTVQNTSSSGGGGRMACVVVDVPGTFNVSGVAIVSIKGSSVALVHGWTASSAPSGSATRVTFKDPTNLNPLNGQPSVDTAASLPMGAYVRCTLEVSKNGSPVTDRGYFAPVAPM